MITDHEDQQRIDRIARALCRSARLDPDAVLDEASRASLPETARGGLLPRKAWMAFRDAARAFAARYPRDIVASL